jgi:parallel beta-helix repeat protein
VDYAWSGPGSPAIVIEGNSISFGIDDPYDPNSVDAMDLGSSSTNVLICANSINSFTDKGISIGESSHPVVRNNVIWDCNMGMGIKDGSSPILDNNTIIECDSGIELFRKSSGPADVVLLNSIIWNCGEGIVLLDGSTISVG